MSRGSWRCPGPGDGGFEMKVTTLADRTETEWRWGGLFCGRALLAGCFDRWRRWRGNLRGGGLEEVAGAIEVLAGGGAEEAVVADLGETAGKDVLEEAGNEVLDLERHAAGLEGSGVGVAEGDLVVLEAFDAVVGEGDTVDVAREVEGRALAVADLLDVGDPGFVFVPKVGIGFVYEPGTSEGVSHLGAKDLGEGVSWEEEARVGRLDPDGAAGGEAAGGDEEVDVGVVGEGAGPGVEYGENRDATADPLGK